jgi:hypothetical protein
MASEAPSFRAGRTSTGLARVVATQGEPARSVRLWGRAEALRDAIGAPLQPIERADYEQAVAAVRTLLGESAFVAAWTQGGAMTTEQVLSIKFLRA